MASREPLPIVGSMVLKLEVSILKGKAPEFILSARLLADSYVKSPEITAFPSVIAVLTVGLEIIVLSIHMEIGVDEPASSAVAEANLSFPDSPSVLVSLS